MPKKPFIAHYVLTAPSYQFEVDSMEEAKNIAERLKIDVFAPEHRSVCTVAFTGLTENPAYKEEVTP